MNILEKLKNLLVTDSYETSNQAFIEPLNAAPYLNNRLQLVFPQQSMTTEDKIIYSLGAEGPQSIVTLKLLTGLPRAEIKSAIAKLSGMGKIKIEEMTLKKSSQIIYSCSSD